MLRQLSGLNSDHPASSLRLEHPWTCPLLPQRSLPHPTAQPLCQLQRWLWRRWLFPLCQRGPRHVQLLLPGFAKQLFQPLLVPVILIQDEIFMEGDWASEQEPRGRPQLDARTSPRNVGHPQPQMVLTTRVSIEPS